jgi:plasmid stabilization system protein ParE
VRFTAKSSRQIDSVLAYIRERSPSGAETVAQRISEAIDLLTDHPRAGRATTRVSARRLSLSPYPYVIFYRLSGSDVTVTRFVHAARRKV